MFSTSGLPAKYSFAVNIELLISSKKYSGICLEPITDEKLNVHRGPVNPDQHFFGIMAKVCKSFTLAKFEFRQARSNCNSFPFHQLLETFQVLRCKKTKPYQDSHLILVYHRYQPVVCNVLQCSQTFTRHTCRIL